LPNDPNNDSIVSKQKISDTQGNFAGILDNGDNFGNSVANIGDVDGDGVEDLAVGAPLDDDGGASHGAVWILFMNSNGMVKSEQKISSTDGDFTGVLGVNDQFGYSVAGIGDLDNDGVEDIAVGAFRDDDGNIDRGAVWILFLGTDGKVDGFQKISDTEGDFTGILDNSDWFGYSVGNIGDLDDDGITDIAVGAKRDDDGSTDRGAVWILFLGTDGKVDGFQKISYTQGDLPGFVPTSPKFSDSVAGIGDLDNDGIEDIVVGAPDDGEGFPRRGAVWILFLGTDGKVDGIQKISDTQGGFRGALTPDGDTFGTSVANMGDLNGDGVTDIVVGFRDVLPNTPIKGAVSILFLGTDGKIDFFQMISNTQGGFEGMLNDGDLFGFSVAGIGDLNNDGIKDLVAGALADDDGGSDRGAAWVLFLEEDKAPPKPCPTCGDFNGDGFDDLAIGVWAENIGAKNSAGAVNVIYGSAVGLHKSLGRADQFWSQDTTGIADIAETGDRFGQSLAIGDFNNDGFDDLAIGAPLEDIGVGVDLKMNAGAVNVIYGSASGLHKNLGQANQFWHQDSRGIAEVAEANDIFGWSLGTGDFNNDGFDDLAIGITKEDIGAKIDVGAAAVIYGSAVGLHKNLGQANQFWSQDSKGIADIAETGDNFGNSLGIGDFNNDGFDDLAIGAPGENLGAGFEGAVNVIYGSAVGLHKNLGQADQFWSQDSKGIADIAELDDFFGYSLAAGDFNNDGFDELAIGVYREDIGAKTNAGAVNVIYGSAVGLHKNLGQANQFWSQDSRGIADIAETEDWLGWSLVICDFNNDGFDELAIGVQREDIGAIGGAGAVNVIYGSAVGLHKNLGQADQFWSQDSKGIADIAETADNFGYEIGAGDFNNDGFNDFVIGTWSEDIGAIGNAGGVNVIYGSAVGLHKNLGQANQFWHQDSRGIADIAEQGNGFGFGLP